MLRVVKSNLLSKQTYSFHFAHGFFQQSQLRSSHPMDARHRAGIHCLLQQVICVNSLLSNTSPAIFIFNVKRLGAHNVAITATNAGQLVNEHQVSRMGSIIERVYT